MNKPVIALVGYPASGKEGVAGILRDRGFASYSGGDVLRRISEDLGLPTDRNQLIGLGNVLRAGFGTEVLMRGVKKKMQEIGQDPLVSGLVVDSLRNPGEVAYLKSELGALVVNVWVPEEIRFERMLKRGKAGDPRTWEEFQALNAIDHGVGQERTGQDIAGCVELADVALSAEGNLTDVETRLNNLLASKGKIEGMPRSARL